MYLRIMSCYTPEQIKSYGTNKHYSAGRKNGQSYSYNGGGDNFLSLGEGRRRIKIASSGIAPYFRPVEKRSSDKARRERSSHNQ